MVKFVESQIQWVESEQQSAPWGSSGGMIAYKGVIKAYTWMETALSGA
jgi:hypothetical protein